MFTVHPPRGLRPGFSETFPFPLRFTPGDHPLAYFDTGDPPPGQTTGPTLLLCHGLGGNFTHFEHLAAPLARRHRVVGLDFPGCGDSVKLPVGKHLRYSIDMYAGATIRLLDHLGIDQAVFVGHSLGGMVVVEAALEHSTRVEALVLINGAGFRRYKAPLKLLAKVLLHPKLVGPAMERLAVTLLRNVFHERNAHTTRFIGQAEGRPPYPTLHDFAVMACSIAPDLVGKHFLDEVERIMQPALVIWGDRDKLLPYGEVGAWVERLRNGRLVTLAGCGHMPIIERPQAVLAALEEFLAAAESTVSLRRADSM